MNAVDDDKTLQPVAAYALEHRLTRERAIRAITRGEIPGKQGENGRWYVITDRNEMNAKRQRVGR